MTLTERIVELVPEIGLKCSTCRQEYTNTCFLDHAGQPIRRPITLADVLRAMMGTKGHPWFVRDDGTFFKWEKFTEGNGHHGVESTWATWNLATDLEGQSDETKAFLSKILGV